MARQAPSQLADPRPLAMPSWLRIGLPGCFIALLAGLLVNLAMPSSQPYRVAVDALEDRSDLADESRCADCHSQATYFWETGHAQTLTLATDEPSRALLATFNSSELPRSEDTLVQVLEDRIVARHHQGEEFHEIELKWCFGSGQHARTWTSTMSDSIGGTDQLEFRWTWYHSENSFDITPGQPLEPSPGVFGSLGVLFDGPKSRRCFACHATYLPESNGAIDEPKIHAGVTCQRCHGPRGKHVATSGEHLNQQWLYSDRMTSIHRCAQCHRRAEELEPDTIRAGNPDIVRFQPVGMVQSACFINSEMTCTTCHDPHLPFSRQDSRGIWQCVQCHNPNQDDHVLCGAGNGDDCIRCHMPSVEMSTPVTFVDHWIRVVSEHE